MRGITDSSYKKMREMKKYKDIYDFSSIECRMALVGMIMIDIVFILCSFYIGVDTTVGKCVAILDDIGMALIGFLGFTVSALAILTGAISSKVVKMLQNRDKMVSLERILLSFYLMGLACAIEVLVAFILHFLVEIPINSVFAVDLLIMSVLTYLTIFIVFYSVKLIGNCLELFYIVNSMELIENKNIDYKAKYNTYRITALEKVLLSSTSVETIQEYKQTIRVLIESDMVSGDEAKILFKLYSEHFGE